MIMLHVMQDKLNVTDIIFINLADSIWTPKIKFLLINKNMMTPTYAIQTKNILENLNNNIHQVLI